MWVGLFNGARFPRKERSLLWKDPPLLWLHPRRRRTPHKEKKTLSQNKNSSPPRTKEKKSIGHLRKERKRRICSQISGCDKRDQTVTDCSPTLILPSSSPVEVQFSSIPKTLHWWLLSVIPIQLLFQKGEGVVWCGAAAALKLPFGTQLNSPFLPIHLEIRKYLRERKRGAGISASLLHLLPPERERDQHLTPIAERTWLTRSIYLHQSRVFVCVILGA